MRDIEFLQIDNESQKGEYLDMLEKLKSQRGWKLLCEKLARIKEMVEYEMFDVSSFEIGTEKRDVGNALKYTDRDILAIQHHYINLLLTFPDDLIASLRRAQSFPEEVNFDPFKDINDSSVNPEDLEGAVL